MRIVDTQEYLDQVCAMLAEGSRSVPVPVSGTSMCPFLHPGDTVYLDLPSGPLKKGDIVLFIRPNGRYILHRVVRTDSSGVYGILGDNQVTPEPVTEDRIRAVVTAVCLSGKTVKPGSPKWWFYAHPWRLLTPVRPWVAALWKGKDPSADQE